MTGPMGQPLAMQDYWTEADAMDAARRQSARTRSARQDDQQRRAILTRTVELDVIPRLLSAHPRLLSAHPTPIVPTPTPPVLLVTAVHVADLVGLVLSRAEPEAVAFVEGMHDQGAAAESIYLDLLAPAARRLGEMWEDDTCDFTEVTIGLWRLQNAMRELSPSFLRSSDIRTNGPRVLLVPLPGEAHTFGLSMVYEFFRRAGWNAWSGPVASSADLRSLVRHEWVEVIGFSLACDEKLDVVRTEIRSVRRASMNPGLGVLVGGPGFTANPLLSAEVGADGTATDGRQAVLQAQALVDSAVKRR
jgi:methanogenic corrinoid protein MtbC1